MLTADLVQVRRRGDRLVVVPLGELERQRALELGAAYLGLARAHVGQPRGALMEALRQVPFGPREQRLARGLAKLVLDRCTFDDQPPVDAADLRRELFTRARAARRTAAVFDRDALLAEVAALHQLTPETLQEALYADLPDAHRLRSFDAVRPEDLVQLYDTAQVQAVLLRAVRVVATVRASPGVLRALFRKLKFLRLLHRIERQGRDGCLIDIDGPFSLFEQVTRYGLQLALAFPALTACSSWKIDAELRWGTDRKALRFQVEGSCARPDEDETALPDEVAALLEDLRAQDSTWSAKVSSAVLDLPGVGLCVPDLELTHRSSRKTVYVEALGFWSRDAVWKRIELAQQGLPHPVVFVVSKHLRVSEEALPDDVPASLYVYARVPSARAILERADRLI